MIAAANDNVNTDLLNMQALNALPQPFMARFCGGDTWPVYDIEVETGLMRIDVCGKLQVMLFADVMELTDCDGVKHDPDSFYLED
jgi:hypothetical protein